jgi:hypothetical protein
MAEMLKMVSFSPAQIDFVLRCFDEAVGRAHRVWGSTFGEDLENLRVPVETFRAAQAEGRSHVALSEIDWRRVFSAVHATIYTLGPLELQTVTSFDLRQAADTNLRICADVWGAFGKATWSPGGSR